MACRTRKFLKLSTAGQVFLLSLFTMPLLQAKADPVSSHPAVLSKKENSSGFALLKSDPSSVTLRRGKIILNISAVQENIFRIRIGRNGALPPDESWAVSKKLRDSSVKIHYRKLPNFFDISTSGGKVRVNSQNGAVTVFNAQGKALLADVADPVQEQENGFRLVKKLAPRMHIFGLGDKHAPLDQRGYVHQNWATDTGFDERHEPLYKDIPFFMIFDQDQAAGVFLDNSWRTVFDFGVQNPEKMSFGADGGFVDYYVMTGPSARDVIGQYTALTGHAPLPPKWAFGFHQSHYSYGDEQALRRVANRLRRDHIPSDVLWLDIDYQDRHRPFTVNQKAFPDFQKLIFDLKKQGFQTVAIADPHIANLPHENYAPYEEGAKKDLFVHAADGSIFKGDVWPGASVFPDFVNMRAREYWGALFKERYIKDGLAGFWNDMDEPSVFIQDMPIFGAGTISKDSIHHISESGMIPRQATHAEIHNLYGMQTSRATYDGLLRLKPDERPFVMTRSTYAGGQRYAVTWTGDNTSSWNHLRLSTPQLLNLGLSGFPFVGDNLGGFGESPSADLLTKWLEIGMFNPIAMDHYNDTCLPQEPWVHGRYHEKIRRNYINARYQLMPYIYTIAKEASQSGVPMMRPLFLEFSGPYGGEPLDFFAPGEFMWGSSLLVAPPLYGEGVQDWKVFLPPGDWYDYWTGEKPKSFEEVRSSGLTDKNALLTDKNGAVFHSVAEKRSLERLPVFVKSGAVIPRQPLTQTVMEKPEGSLELGVYTGPVLSGEIYEDDGKSLDYQKGAYFHQKFTGKTSEQGGELSLEKPSGTYQPWWKEVKITLYGIEKPVKFYVNEKAVKGRFDRKSHTISVKIPFSKEKTAIKWQYR